LNQVVGLIGLLFFMLVACNTVTTTEIIDYTLITSGNKSDSYKLNYGSEDSRCKEFSSELKPPISHSLAKARLLRLKAQYLKSIRSTLKKHWRKPVVLLPGAQCLIQLTQCLNGAILEYQINLCSDPYMVNSIKSMFKRISQMPIAPDRAVWTSEFEIQFKPY